MKRNFLRLYQLAEEIKTNSKTYESFDECFPKQRYEELKKTKNKGLLELLASDEKLNWPGIELVGQEDGDVFRVSEGSKRSINGDSSLEELSSIDYQAIRSVLSRELKRGSKTSYNAEGAFRSGNYIGIPAGSSDLGRQFVQLRL